MNIVRVFYVGVEIRMILAKMTHRDPGLEIDDRCHSDDRDRVVIS